MNEFENKKAQRIFDIIRDESSDGFNSVRDEWMEKKEAKEEIMEAVRWICNEFNIL